MRLYDVKTPEQRWDDRNVVSGLTSQEAINHIVMQLKAGPWLIKGHEDDWQMHTTRMDLRIALVRCIGALPDNGLAYFNGLAPMFEIRAHHDRRMNANYS